MNIQQLVTECPHIDGGICSYYHEYITLIDSTCSYTPKCPHYFKLNNILFDSWRFRLCSPEYNDARIQSPITLSTDQD